MDCEFSTYFVIYLYHLWLFQKLCVCACKYLMKAVLVDVAVLGQKYEVNISQTLTTESSFHTYCPENSLELVVCVLPNWSWFGVRQATVPPCGWWHSLHPVKPNQRQFPLRIWWTQKQISEYEYVTFCNLLYSKFSNDHGKLNMDWPKISFRL